jgi:hypothetical protein
VLWNKEQKGKERKKKKSDFRVGSVLEILETG